MQAWVCDYGANREVYSADEYLQYRADYAASSNGFGNQGYYIKPTTENLNKHNLTEAQWRNYDAIGQGSTNMEDIWLQRIGLGEIERETIMRVEHTTGMMPLSKPD